MQSYLAAMFVLFIDIFKACAMVVSKSCAIKNPVWSLLKHSEIQVILEEIWDQLYCL